MRIGTSADPRQTHSNSGPAAIVVTSVMMTITVNSVGVIRPRCSPMLRMISSISPRAFMSAPIAIASRFGRPARRAAPQQPTAFPADATRITTIESHSSSADHSERELRRQAGKREEHRHQHVGCDGLDATAELRVSRPAAEKRADDECDEDRVRGRGTLRRRSFDRRWRARRRAGPRDHVARPQPATSASVPSAVPPMPRSWMMRASTGNAVTDIAAPRYIMLCQRDTLARRNGRPRTDATPARRRAANGATTPASEISMALRNACLMKLRLQMRADDEHVQDETDLAHRRQHAATTLAETAPPAATARRARATTARAECRQSSRRSRAAARCAASAQPTARQAIRMTASCRKN